MLRKSTRVLKTKYKAVVILCILARRKRQETAEWIKRIKIAIAKGDPILCSLPWVLLALNPHIFGSARFLSKLKS